MFCTHISPRSAARRGFTLIELLAVVHVVSILISLSLPIYLHEVSESQFKTCRSNMHTLANVVQSERVKLRRPDYATLIHGGVTTASLPDLKAIPLCPSGGAYTLEQGSSGDNTTFKILCGLSGHGQFEPGVDAR